MQPIVMKRPRRVLRRYNFAEMPSLNCCVILDCGTAPSYKAQPLFTLILLELVCCYIVVIRALLLQRQWHHTRLKKQMWWSV